VLGEVQRTGSELPGAHHFYITFKTGAPDVSIPAHLRERFPDEMTIVLQNKFWDLKVDDVGFSVGLSFNQVPASFRSPSRRSPPSSTRRSISGCSSRLHWATWRPNRTRMRRTIRPTTRWTMIPIPRPTAGTARMS